MLLKGQFGTKSRIQGVTDSTGKNTYRRIIPGTFSDLGPKLEKENLKPRLMGQEYQKIDQRNSLQ